MVWMIRRKWHYGHSGAARRDETTRFLLTDSQDEYQAGRNPTRCMIRAALSGMTERRMFLSEAESAGVRM